jgi:hypothetical protein
MKGVQLQNQLTKIAALVVASVVLPLVAYLGFSGQNNNQNGQSQNRNGQGDVPVVPEANPVWVLVPIFGAVVLLSSRQLRTKANRKNGSLS